MSVFPTIIDFFSQLARRQDQQYHQLDNKISAIAKGVKDLGDEMRQALNKIAAGQQQTANTLTEFEAKMSQASERLMNDLEKLDADVAAAESQETADHAEVAQLNAQIVDLKAQLAAAEGSGDAAAVEAAAAKIEALDARVVTLGGSSDSAPGNTGVAGTVTG